MHLFHLLWVEVDGREEHSLERSSVVFKAGGAPFSSVMG